jgi:hypothetical protein
MDRSNNSGASRRPLWSLVSAVRNDNYMGNYLWRLSTCINYLAWNLQELGRLEDVEVVLADWDSAVPMHQALPLTAAAAKITRFVVIPPVVAASFHFDSTFPSPFITNIGLRRATGEYIVNIEADTCFTRSSLATLFQILEGKLPLEVPLDQAYCLFSRRQVPVERSARRPTVKELDLYLARTRCLLPMDPLCKGFGGRAGGAMMHRSLWHAARGLDGTCIHWGWNDCDLHLRMTMSRQWVDLANYGVEVIHLEHYAGKLGRAAGPPRRLNPEIVPTRPVHDQPHWGLPDYDLPIARATNIVPDSALEAPPHLPGTVEDWPLTLDDLRRQVDSDEAHAFLDQAVAYWLRSDLLQTHGHDRRFAAEMVRLRAYPLHEAVPVAWLAWYGKMRHPRSYVEIGPRHGFSICLVAGASPGVELYGIDGWQPDRYGPAPVVWQCVNPLLDCGGNLNYVRFVTGDPATAVTRLFAGPAAPVAIDLALVRTDPAFGDAVANTLQLAEHLAAGGLLVITGPAVEVDPVLRAVRGRFPQFTSLLASDGQTALILAARLAPTGAVAPAPTGA